MQRIDEYGEFLNKFYRSDIGKAYTYAIKQKLKKIWNPDHINSEERILYCGYNTPYSDLYNMDYTTKFTPYSLDPKSDAIVSPYNLPLRDAQFNRIFSANVIEDLESLDNYILELWRVLEPEGRLMIVIANKTGFWKKHPITGNHFNSNNAIITSLNNAKFKLHSISKAVYFPPMNSPSIANILNKLCGIFLPFMNGVTIIEAEKRIYAPRGRTIKLVPSLRELITGRKAIANTNDIA